MRVHRAKVSATKLILRIGPALLRFCIPAACILRTFYWASKWSEISDKQQKESASFGGKEA